MTFSRDRQLAIAGTLLFFVLASVVASGVALWLWLSGAAGGEAALRAQIERDQARSQLAELEEEREALVAERDLLVLQIEDERAALAAERGRLEAAAEAARADARLAEQRANSLEARASQTAGELAAAQEAASEARAEASRLAALLAENQASFENRQAELEQALEEAQARIEQGETRLDTVMRERDAALEASSVAGATNGDGEVLAAFEARLQGLLRENAILREERDRTLAELRGANARIAEIDGEVEAVASVSARAAEAEDRVEALEALLADARENAGRAAAEAAQERRAERERAEELERSLQAARETIAELERREGARDVDAETNRRLLAAARRAAERSEDEREALEEELARALERLEDDALQIEELAAQVAELEGALEAARFEGADQAQGGALAAASAAGRSDGESGEGEPAPAPPPRLAAVIEQLEEERERREAVEAQLAQLRAEPASGPPSEGERSASALERRVVELETMLDESRQAAQQRATELEARDRRIAELVEASASGDDVGRSLAAAEDAIRALSREKRALETELELMRNAVAAEPANSASAPAGLAGDLARALERIEQLEGELARYNPPPPQRAPREDETPN